MGETVCGILSIQYEVFILIILLSETVFTPSTVSSIPHIQRINLQYSPGLGVAFTQQRYCKGEREVGYFKV